MRLLGLVLACASLVFGTLSPALATPLANELVRCPDLIAAVGAGAFTWSGAAQTCPNPNVIITRGYFTTYISNNGSCVGGGSDYVLLYGDMLNCKSGGSVLQQSLRVGAQGASTYHDVHGICQTTGASTMVFSTGNAVAPTSGGTAITYTGATASQSYGATLKNAGGATVATWSYGTSGGSNSYSNSIATAGVYTLTISGLTNVTCPTVGTGGSASGTLYWFQ